jgi:hypothetical protein
VVDATVKELTEALASIVAEEQLTLRKTSAKSFLKNYETGYEHIISEMREMAANVLETPVIFAREKPTRFERLQFFLDLSSWDDPGFSSAKIAEFSIESLQDVDVTSLKNTRQAEGVVRDAFDLLAMRHFQFRGAPNDEALITKGCEIAAAFVSNLTGAWKSKIDFGMIEELEMALLMCQMAKDSRSFQVICDKVPPKMISDDLRGGGDPPLAYGQLLLLIISRFRKRRFKVAEDIDQQIEKGRSKRAKLLLRAWTAVLQQDVEALADSLRASLEHFRSNPDKNVGGNHMPARIAIAESIISNIATADGMEIHLPTELDDLMMLARRA